MIRQLAIITIACWFCADRGQSKAPADEFDLVIRGGRVMDPESGLDGIRDLGIADGTIGSISEMPLSGRKTIEATGLVVAPGFIDLHQHSWDEESITLKVLDGVTSILELEVGTADVDRWYRDQEGTLPLNFGVSIGHIPVRMAVMGDSPAFLPPAGARAITEAATPEQIEAMSQRIVQGIDAGAVAVGFGLAYTPAATDEEILAMFRVAASRHASCHIHLRGRGKSGGGPQAAMDAARLAAAAGASLHFVHYQAGAKETMPEMLRLVESWRASGQDVSAEAYPWTAGMTEIKSAIFAEGFQQRLGIDYNDLQWGITGERLNAESFQRYRDQGGLVIVHNNTEAAVELAVTHPSIMIASDGLRGHPRNAGTYARMLGHYVREAGGLELMAALRKISLLPAQRLERLANQMQKKGRIQVGCDADLTLFDPKTVNARATYEAPFRGSQGIAWVLVGGVPVAHQGERLADAKPGRAIRGQTK